MRIHLADSKALLSSFFVVLKQKMFSSCSHTHTHFVFFCTQRTMAFSLELHPSAIMIFITNYKWKHILFRIHFHFHFIIAMHLFAFFSSHILFSYPFVLVRNIVDAVNFKINDAMINGRANTCTHSLRFALFH